MVNKPAFNVVTYVSINKEEAQNKKYLEEGFPQLFFKYKGVNKITLLQALTPPEETAKEDNYLMILEFESEEDVFPKGGKFAASSELREIMNWTKEKQFDNIYKTTSLVTYKPILIMQK